MRKASVHGYSKILIFGTVLFMMGCASDPVPTYLPANHPANPEAAEATYAVAPNPFQDKMSMNEMKITDGHSRPHQGHENSPAHKMKPMLKNGHKDPENSTEAEKEKSDHQHQEHN